MDTNGHIPLYEDYVSFEIAKLLKEKGFDEECRAFYVKSKECGIELFHAKEPYNYNNNVHPCTSAPTLQMVMKWLREVYHLHISIEMGFDVDNHQYFFFVPSICKFSNKTGEYQTPFDEEEFDTYEQAVETAIKYCLENLI